MQTTISDISSQSLAVRFGNSRRVAAVGSILEAVQAWERLRDENDLGASRSPKVTVIDGSGAFVCSISYNGRAWLPDGSEVAL